MSLSIRVFDTVLDGKNINDTVTRNSSDFWKVFCNASGWSFNYERVHSLADLEFFMSRVIKQDIIIFSGHGNEDGWHMTNREVFIPSTFNHKKIHEKNFGKIVIFSSCLIGKSEQLCKEYKSLFGARKLFAYRHVMHDRYCFLNESILLSMLEQVGSFSESDFIDFKEKTLFMKNLNKKHVRLHPMVMF